MDIKNPEFEIKDSGVHHDFDTGSRRDSQEGKGAPDLISMFMLDRLAKHYEAGSVKYASRNWELGQPASQYMRSAMRHIIKWMMGKRGEDHLAAIIWNISGIIHNEALVSMNIYDKALLDTPNYQSPEFFLQTVKGPALKENAKRKEAQHAEILNASQSEGQCCDESPSVVPGMPEQNMHSDR